MKRGINIIIVGAGACGLAMSRLLSSKFPDEVIIVTAQDSLGEHKEEIVRQSQFEPEPIPFLAQPRFDEYVPTKKEIESYHPFAKFIGKPSGKKGGKRRRW